MEDELLTPREVATRLRINKYTVVKWLQEGKIPGLKLIGRWRIRESDVQKLIDASYRSRRT